MSNNTPIGWYAAMLAMAGATFIPFIARADTLLDADAYAQQVSGSTAIDSDVERTAMPPRQEVNGEWTWMPAPALRPYDPARRCGNIMLTWDDPCEYASRAPLSVERAGVRR